MEVRLRVTHIILVAVCVIFGIVSLAMSYWKCGSIFSTCQQYEHKHTINAVASLLVVGILSFMVNLCMDGSAICVKTLPEYRSFRVANGVFVTIGACLMVAAVVVYAMKIDHQWSYFFAMIASSLGANVAIMRLVVMIPSARHGSIY